MYTDIELHFTRRINYTQIKVFMQKMYKAIESLNVGCYRLPWCSVPIHGQSALVAL